MRHNRLLQPKPKTTDIRWQRLTHNEATTGPTFDALLREFKRVLPEPRAKGGGLAAAMSIFLAQLQGMDPESAVDYVRSLCRQRCFQVKDLRLPGRGRAVQWHNEHSILQKALLIAGQMKEDPVNAARTFSLGELREVFLRARFLVSATRAEGPLRVEEWYWPGTSAPPQDPGMLRQALHVMLRHLTVVDRRNYPAVPKESVRYGQMYFMDMGIWRFAGERGLPPKEEIIYFSTHE